MNSFDEFRESIRWQLQGQLENQLKRGIYNQIFEQFYWLLEEQLFQQLSVKNGLQLYYTLRDDNL